MVGRNFVDQTKNYTLAGFHLICESKIVQEGRFSRLTIFAGYLFGNHDHILRKGIIYCEDLNLLLMSSWKLYGYLV